MLQIILRFAIIGVIVFLSTVIGHAKESLPEDTGKVTASLVSSHDSLAPGDTFHVALRTVLDEHWHTYWRNPGDSGEPVQINWYLPEEVSTQGDLIWPVPRTLPTGPIINYGFEGAPLFPQKFQITDSAVPGDIITLRADVYYLVCYDVCIPEDAKLSITLAIGEREIDPKWSTVINHAITDSPKPKGETGGIKKTGEQLIITILPPSQGDYSQAYFFPYEQGILGHSAPQIVRVGDAGIEITTQPSYLWDEPITGAISGVLTYKRNGQIYGDEITLTTGQSVEIGLSPLAGKTVSGGSNGPALTLWAAIFGAFIGGLILNLMPCVFPVISIKALSIAKAAHGEKTVIRREAWAYTAGVLATFLLLTLVLLALKAAGSEIGWGFQLQNPKVVGVLAVLLFVIGLNLLGLFEFGTALQNTGGTLTQKSGFAGSFFTGALAVVVATPCTAPFMAGAVGYALAQTALITLCVFMALAVGFALPFLLIAYVPKLLSALPKPGPWMERFRQFLAFPMLGAAVWLVWVLALQSGEDGVLLTLAAMLSASFAIWLLKGQSALSKGLAIAAIIATIIFPVMLKTAPSSTVHSSEAGVWSPERVAQLQAEGRPVFVDFTAAWCVTCKVNEKLVLSKQKTQALFVQNDVAFLIADWTNKNDVIARELEFYGRSGVPLYLMFPANHTGQNFVKAEVLPQVLTYDVLKSAIDRAKNGQNP